MKISKVSHFYNWIIYQSYQTFLFSSVVNFNYTNYHFLVQNFIFFFFFIIIYQLPYLKGLTLLMRETQQPISLNHLYFLLLFYYIWLRKYVSIYLRIISLSPDIVYFFFCIVILLLLAFKIKTILLLLL